MSEWENARRKVASEREAMDIAFVRQRTGLAHVSDPDAMTEFASGRGIFDIDPHCRKLDAFVAEHNLDPIIESEEILPPDRPVYFGRARGRKRSLTSDGPAVA